MTDKAMDTLGFGEEDKAAVFRVLAALLHLGNVRFEVRAARACLSSYSWCLCSCVSTYVLFVFVFVCVFCVCAASPNHHDLLLVPPLHMEKIGWEFRPSVSAALGVTRTCNAADRRSPQAQGSVRLPTHHGLRSLFLASS